MIALLLFQTGFSFVLYLLLFSIPWSGARRRKDSNKAYFIGLLFSTLFYYGIPIWLWFYGFKTTFFLIITCIGATIILAKIIATTFDIKEAFTVGILLQIPIRVIAGGWLAKNHACLRTRSTAE